MTVLVTLTSDRWAQLCAVQRDVNARMTYQSDLELYGTPELWTVADGVAGARDQGDCEDYALTKLRALRDAHGWPRAALRLTTCWDEGGGYHAVLTVDTDHGTYALDNRQADVAPWAALPYRWDKRERPGLPEWEAVGQPLG